MSALAVSLYSLGGMIRMAGSRYPRRNQRLAPSTLREVLRIPIPEKFLAKLDRRARSSRAGMMLCDLDESAWERFDESTCQALATEVLQAVSRAARMPTATLDQRLPPLPQGLRLTNLDLEIRTLNCLIAAGLHERPQDLCEITVEGMLALRGFWVKCLVDLLTSLEYVIDHPESHRRIKARATVPHKTDNLASPYPRPGFRLAPKTLQEILAVPAPAELVRSTPLEGKQLCDLDEKVWELVPPQLVGRLAEAIVSRVSLSGYSQVIQQRQLPKPPRFLRLDDLHLENRTCNCLRRGGFRKRLDDLGNRTVGNLLSIKGFGAKCLIDLLSSLETLASRGRTLDRTLTAEVEALAAIREAQPIHFSDPRLGPLLRTTDTEANTVGELVEHVRHRRVDPPDPLFLRQQVAVVRRTIEDLSQRTLEEELMQIFSPAASGRDREIVAAYHGWNGDGGHTLEELGRKYGLSRERIRQVCVRAVKRARRTKVYTPVLDRALAFIAKGIPASAERLRTQFQEAGYTRCGLALETVQTAARLLGREPGFEIVAVGDCKLAVRPGQALFPRAIIQAAKRAALSFGATTLGEVAAEVAKQCHESVDEAIIVGTLETLPDFQWLDRSRGWFQLESLPQYGLWSMIEKILSVARQINVARLREAMSRYRRTGKKLPPCQVLLEFCRHLPGVCVQEKQILADPPRDWRTVLSGVEAGMVRVLMEHGPVLERGAFEEYCIRDGLNRFSFNAVIMCSPVIVQFGRSVYGLLGATVDPATVELLAASRAGAISSRVLWGFGRSADGRHYLAYQLSKAAISGGVITVPAAMKEKLDGKFDVGDSQGHHVGTLVSKNGCAWGLGPVLRGQSARPGDYLLILFNVRNHTAQVEIGDQRILEALGEQAEEAVGLDAASE